MDWKNNIRSWRSLSSAQQQARSLERSPTHVWQSMAFEREAVSLSWLMARHDNLMPPPAASTPPSDD